MIRTVRIRGFKRFGEVEFRLPGHVVLAGPNNTGKTTILQAIASWSLALRRWRELNDYNPREGYARAPIARQAFAAVPLRSFDLMWRDRRYGGQIEIGIRHDAGWSVTMELIADSTEQIYVRPGAEVPADRLRELDPGIVYVPPMTGLETNERLLQPAAVEQILGLGRPGEVLRNLLVTASREDSAWAALQDSIGKLFGYELLPPDASGPYIQAEYRAAGGARPLDIASAGSGFQQVLMLLAFLHARDHHEALQLVREGLPALELRDGDARPPVPDSEITGTGLQRLRWRRYEIESYLIHPDALTRFVEAEVGVEAAESHVEDMLACWRDEFPPAVVREPLGNHGYLNETKARTILLSSLLEAAGLHALPYTRYHEIAALMLPREIHPEVVEKLDAICRAFGVEP